MPRKRPDPRKGKEKLVPKMHNHMPNLFGTKEPIKGAKYQQTTKVFGKTIHWHADRRKRKGTVRSRKNK